MKIWYDDLLRRLNVDGRGKYLGEFDGDDRILQVHKEGWYELSSFELSNHFDADLLLIQKFDAERAFTVVQYEGKAKNYFIKRFVFESIAIGKKQSLISEETGSKFLHLTSNPEAVLTVDVLKGKTQIPETLEIVLADFIDLKGIKANGNRLTQHEVKHISISNDEENEPVLEEEVKEEVTVVAEEGEDTTEKPETEAVIAEEETTEEEVVEESPVEVVSPVQEAEEAEVEVVEEKPAEEPVVEAVAPVKEVKAKKVEVVEEKPAEETLLPAPEPLVLISEPDRPKAEKPAQKAVKPKKSLDAKSKVTKEGTINKNVRLEITNPDDLDIDDKGQLGLF